MSFTFTSGHDNIKVKWTLSTSLLQLQQNVQPIGSSAVVPEQQRLYLHVLAYL